MKVIFQQRCNQVHGFHVCKFCGCRKIEKKKTNKQIVRKKLIALLLLQWYLVYGLQSIYAVALELDPV